MKSLRPIDFRSRPTAPAVATVAGIRVRHPDGARGGGVRGRGARGRRRASRFLGWISEIASLVAMGLSVAAFFLVLSWASQTVLADWTFQLRSFSAEQLLYRLCD